MEKHRLSIVLDAVGTMRNHAGGDVPDLLTAAVACQLGGISQFVVSYGDDHAAAQTRDLRLLRQLPHVHLDLQIALMADFATAAFEFKPEWVTLVAPAFNTQGRPMDLAACREPLKKAVQTLHDANVRVCVCIEPSVDQVRVAHRADVDAVVLCTHGFATHQTSGEWLNACVDSVRTAHKFGLQVDLGGNLHGDAIVALRELAEVRRFRIGRTFWARSLFVGVDRAIADVLKLLP